jgi:hypothetical protein
VILGYAVIVAALALAAWGGLAALRGRAPDWWLYVASAAVAGLVGVQAAIAVVQLATGGGAGVRVGLFSGYLITAVVLIPCAIVLARLEPTKWGSVILASGGIVLAPLTLRLIQIWNLGG